MSEAVEDKAKLHHTSMSNDGDASHDSSDSATLVVYDRATDSIVEAEASVRKPSAQQGMVSVFDVDTDTSGTDLTVSISGTRKQIACVHATSLTRTSRYAKTHKRTRSEDYNTRAHHKLIREEKEWRAQEAEMIGDIINLESKYAELEKNINLERIHNAYLKATCRQYRKKAKHIRSIALASCERDDSLFHECNRKIEDGSHFDGSIDSESDTGIKESSSSSSSE